MNEILKNTTNAAGQAFDNVRRLTGVPTDPNVRLYLQMTPYRFNELERRVGTEQVMKYISVMETKLRRNQNASS